jgi:hypothetical protein
MRKLKTKDWWLALGVLAIGAMLYISQNGIYPRYFDIAWDEEVQLHDGRVIVVYVKRTFERRSHWSRYEHTIFRSNEFTFDGGEKVGQIQFRSRLGVGYIDQIDLKWYSVLYGQGPYGNHPDEMPNYWGNDFTMKEERLARLDGGKFSPISWDLAPTGGILRNNFVIGSVPLDVLAGFDGKKMTLADKDKLRTIYPPGPGGGEISRPIRMQKLTSGVRK